MTTSQLQSHIHAIPFKVGDVVVYPTHGVGEITAEEVQVVAGTEMSLYVISTVKGNVKIRVPKTRASKTGLRHLSSENELTQAINVLRQKSASKKGNWPKRAQKYGDKINSGNPTLIAEVVRDLHRNDNNQGGTSYSERMLYETAVERLVSEYALSTGVDEKAAENKIMSILNYKICVFASYCESVIISLVCMLMEACKWYASTALLCLFLYVIYLLLVSSSQVIINYMKSNNVIAISWFLLSLLISVFNDTIVKTLVVKISAESIAFWRTMLSAVILMPIVCKLGIQSIYTKKINVHVARGFILAIAISLWNYGIGLVPIATVTLMSFTIPIFTLVMASIFLHEKITYSILLATCVGLTGSIISLLTVDTSFPMASFIFIVASILFATLDIVNKKLLNDGESMLPMLFYSNLFSALFASFVPGSISEYYSAMPIYYVQLICLGVGANLVLYCIIKAFSYANASFLAPVRYMELVVSATTGYVIFNEVVSVNLIVGGVLILISLTIVNHMQRKIHVE